MLFLGFSPYFIFSSFLTTLLLDRGVRVTGNKQFPSSSQWVPSATQTAKTPKNESESVKKVLPLVTFDCKGKTGYFTDSKFNCEVFHYCQPDGARNTFNCPVHQLFNQLSMVCEEKTAHNIKLCKEGSINPAKLQKNQTMKKISYQKLNPVLQPFLNSNSSNNTTKKIMTLEDLLSYMNREQSGKKSEPTFISRFHNAQEPQKQKILPESAITTPKTDNKSAKDKKPSKSMDAQLQPEGSDQILRITNSSSKSEDTLKKNEEESVSAEYDAIEGRKHRKHKRVGRVLDVERDHQPIADKEKRPHAHMTERSASEPPHQEITTPPATGDTDTKDNNTPSLFSTDRNKARDIRKKKRYQGRKRKTTTAGPDSGTDVESEVTVTTAMPSLAPTKQNLDSGRNNAHRRRKNQRTRPREESYKIIKPEKVEPYTLPPLPTPVPEKIETTTLSMRKEESGRSKNPWYKTTLPPPDEDAKFGAKITETDEHQHKDVVHNPPPKRDFYDHKDPPYTSDELLSEEYRERLTMQSNHPGDSRHSDRSSAKHSKKHNDDSEYKYASHFETYQTTAPENLFPPPRAEPREHHSTPPQQMMLDYGSSHHKSKSHSYSKTTTEDPFQVTHSYLDKYQEEVHEFKDLDKNRWKADPEEVKPEEKKVEVGSTFSFQDPIISETTKKPRMQISPATESPVAINMNKEKDITKHTLAHQHLSKIMNDFFAMSSSGIPGRLNIDVDKDEHAIVPDYRIPDEDIYTGSESVAEDVGEIPSELLEVVDLITSNSENEKSNLKPRTRHEVIKINGPITDSHLEKIFLDEKFDRDFEQHPSTDGSFKKIVVIPQPEVFKENIRATDDEEDEIRSLKLESLLKQLSSEKSPTEEEITSIRLESFLKQLSNEKSTTDEEIPSLKLVSLLKQITGEKSRIEEENIPLKIATILRELTDEKTSTEEEMVSLKLGSILKQLSGGKSTRNEDVTSLDKLEPFLKQLLNKKSLTVIPLQQEREIKPQQSVLTAKKVPVRVIYRDQLAETIRPKPSTRKPTAKIAQAHRTAPRVKGFTNEKRQTKLMMHPLSTNSRPQIILHPPTLFPPHPPPLPTKQYPFRVGYPFVTHPMSHIRNIRPVHSRKKRSVMSRLRRQIQHNQHFLPFSSPVYPSFNPKFVPTFSPFKALFNPSSMHTSGSHLAPFSFPGFPFPKPSQNRPHIFRPSHPRPPPVRHISPTGHQTVIVEEVPVPVHVEVPSPNVMHPSPSGPHSSKMPPRYPENQFRNPSPPAVQNPQFVQRPQNRYPQPPPDFRPISVPSNSRPPASINPPPYRSPIPMTGPLPPRITSQGQVYALGVANKPILPPPNGHPARPPNGDPKPPRNLPSPYSPFSVHANSYPNFPYFQGAFTTPISDEPIIGRVMYSGYRPPKSTLGTKPPTATNKDKDRKASESNSNRSSSKPAEEYFQALSKPMRESHVSYTEEVISKGRSRAKPHTENYPLYHTTVKYPGQSSSHFPPSEEIPRKRKPGRRRRPRPYSTTTQGSPILNEISPTPPPPEQIPPPPADYTSKPSNHESFSSSPNFSADSKTHETSSQFPPAGYYGKDQLLHFFDSSSKPQQASSVSNPYHQKKFGEGRSSTENSDSRTSSSVEDGDEPVFGMRIRSKPGGSSRTRDTKPKQHPRSQTQKNEIRTRPYNRPQEVTEANKNEFSRPLEDNKPPQQIRNEKEHAPTRNENPLPKKRRPPSRPRPRRPPPPRPQPEVHHFNYNENMENFYSVPRGLHTVIKPSEHRQQGFRGTTDMFGIQHPAIDQSIFSLRPQGAPDFDPNFFSVPSHIAQQQQSPLHKMNIKPIPESAREFFTAPEINSSTISENSEPDKKESESRNLPSKTKEENKVQREHPVRKLRKPKRKNRYNPHSNEQKDTSEINNVKPQTEPVTQTTVRYREKTTTVATTTAEPRSTTTIHHQAHNDIKESTGVFKQRSPLLPKTLPELSKSLMDGKIDIQKLNATISTSVSVSGAVPQDNDTSSEEKENRRVFSAQNGGGLAVVRKSAKRKRPRQRVSTSTGVPYINSDSDNDAKYEIAASVLDIIKATTETERQASGQHDSTRNEKPSSSKITNTWVESPSNKRQST